MGDYIGGVGELLRAGDDPRDESGIAQPDSFALHAGLGRELDEYGTRAAGTHLAEGFEDGIGTSLGRRARRCHLVTERTVPGWSAISWTAAQIAAHCAARDLAGNYEDGRGAGVRGGESGGGVIKAHAGNHQG